MVRGRLRGPSGEYGARLLLDTGATWSLINPRVFAVVGIDPLRSKGRLPITTVSGVAHAAMVQVSDLAVLGVLRKEFELVAYALPPTAPFDGLLGLDLKGGELAAEA